MLGPDPCPGTRSAGLLARGTTLGPQLCWAWQSWRGCGGRLGRLSAWACLPAGRGLAAGKAGEGPALEEGLCLADRERELRRPSQMSGLGLGSAQGAFGGPGVQGGGEVTQSGEGGSHRSRGSGVR